jgi:hypothetical protein
MASTVGWELGADGDFGLDGDLCDEEGSEFGAENRDDLDAINRHIVDTSRKVDGWKVEGKITGSQYSKFFKLYDDWKSFYKYVIGTWYVSDEDLNVAKKKRDDINLTVQPEATKTALKYSAQAKGGVDVKKYEAETQSFLQRHWLPILGLTLAGGAAVYVSGAALAYLQLAKKSGIIKALGH